MGPQIGMKKSPEGVRGWGQDRGLYSIALAQAGFGGCLGATGESYCVFSGTNSFHFRGPDCLSLLPSGQSLPPTS